MIKTSNIYSKRKKITLGEFIQLRFMEPTFPDYFAFMSNFILTKKLSLAMEIYQRIYLSIVLYRLANFACYSNILIIQ